MLPGDFAGIPDELRAEDRWVLWRLDWVKERWSKVPYRPSGGKASSTDPKTWTNFAAVERMYNRGGHDGIGFVLGDGWAGVDLDDVRDAKMLTMHPAAMNLIEEHGGHSDISPSGTGIKIIGRGKWEADWHRKQFPAMGGEVEVYTSGRYFTVTGVGSSLRHDAELKPIWDIQPLLDSLAALGASPPAKTAPAPAPAATTPRETNLDDADLIERARRAKNCAKFARLWAGDTSEHGGNDSSADLALCDLLAFWCGGDAARIDGLFRQSGLMRGKWDERRGELTYGERTIAVALKDRTEFYDPKPSRSRLPIPSTNGKAHDHGDQADEPQTAAQIIEQYIRERYRPVFRVGNSIHTDSGETIPMTVGVGVPNSGLIDRLAQAINAPRFPDAAGGGVKHEQLPGLFRKWGSTAWGDLLDSLPEEDEAELGQDSPTAETFRRLVRDAMFTGVTLGDVIGHTNITQIERRSMISWCIRFATPGPWRSIRDYACWCQRRQSADGELVLRVAIRHEMFAQIKTDKRLTEMTATKWAPRAARYGVGASAESDRPHGRKAVVLSPEFLAEITAGIPDDLDAEICPRSEAADGPEMVGQDSGPSEGMQPSVTRILA